MIGSQVRISHWAVNLSPSTQAVLHQHFTSMRSAMGLGESTRCWGSFPEPLNQASVLSQESHRNSP